MSLQSVHCRDCWGQYLCSTAVGQRHVGPLTKSHLHSVARSSSSPSAKLLEASKKEKNKLASLEATLVRNYDPATYLLTGVKCKATSVAKKV